MVPKSSLYNFTEQSFSDYLGRLFPPGSPLRDEWWAFNGLRPHEDENHPIRSRSRSDYGFETPYHILYEDGEPVLINTLSPWKSYQETLDVSNGKSPVGRWVGGPFCSYNVRYDRNPSGWHKFETIERPAFLWPPKSVYHRARYIPPFLEGSYQPDSWNLNGPITGPDATSIKPLIDIAFARVESARNSARPDSRYSDFGTSILELRETAQLVKLRGNNRIAQGASAYLSYEFGWKPLFSDLLKLSNLANSLKKRLDFIKANEGLPVSRERLLFNYTENLGKVAEVSYDDGGSYFTVVPKGGTYDITGILTAQAKYHSTLYYELYDFDYTEYWDQIASARLSGLQLDGHTLWESIPWTWLVDWFSNVGDFVETKFSQRIADTHILDEWVTVNASVETLLTLPAVTGGVPPHKAVGTALSRRVDEIKLRGVPPVHTPLTVVDLFGFRPRQLAIMLALNAKYLR